MSSCYETADSLGQAMLGHAEVGDRRRSARLVTTFEQMRRHPGGTLPDKLSSPADLKALYRLCACRSVTHQALVAAMRNYTLERISNHHGSVLVVHDAAELDYTSLESLENELGQIGKGTHRGYICQNVIALDPQTGEVLGLLDQILHSRDEVRKVRGGHEPDGPEGYLKEYVQGLPELGSYTMDVQRQKGRKARKQAEFSVRGGAILLLPPHAKHGLHGDDPLPIYVVYVREVNPPAGEEPIEWMLLTNEPVVTFDDAWRVISWYEQRWVIEEYHKAMKTGCRIEDIQFTAVERLQPAIALLSGVALTLLNLRDASRRPDASTRRAATLFAAEYVEVLSVWRYRKLRNDLTVHDFFFALARLGGHQNRKSDHRPGWLVLWRGWMKLQYMLDGYLAAKRKKCGET